MAFFPGTKHATVAALFGIRGGAAGKLNKFSVLVYKRASRKILKPLHPRASLNRGPRQIADKYDTDWIDGMAVFSSGMSDVVDKWITSQNQ